MAPNLGKSPMESKAERAIALKALAKRRNGIAARRQSGKHEPSRALVLYNPRKANTLSSSNITARKQSGNNEPSRALVLYNPSGKSNNLPTTFEDIKKITIGRSTLEKWYLEPFFEDLISGCFVRISIGKAHSKVPVYRLCMVRNTDATKSDCYYRFGNGTTCKYLNLVWGSDRSTARWKMTSVTDSPPLEAEFGQLVKEASRFGGYVPTRNEVSDKIEAIRALTSSVRNERAVKLAELNRKNKIENFKNASSSKRKSTDMSEHDPFSRRWTRSRSYFAMNSCGGATTARNGGAVCELNKLHDFEMSISLAALERFGGPRGVGAGYMANKGRIEAAYGRKVAVDEPAKHPHAMSVASIGSGGG